MRDVVHRAAPPYSDVYKSVSNSRQGNSFRLVVKIRDSGIKGSRFRSMHCHRDDTKHPIHAHLGHRCEGSSKHGICLRWHLIIEDEMKLNPTGEEDLGGRNSTFHGPVLKKQTLDICLYRLLTKMGGKKKMIWDKMAAILVNQGCQVKLRRDGVPGLCFYK
ncbi:hypothetical protein AVEN_124226-1 [Araneus ventricosus]|uniref:Uncharacterized protein n=1 Tax=Araneus ventricosus TaxID=182803 RepID=A0A4Y2VGB8_ARAVE|nr:hypothetical protein AVEN_124226-1 [Araneus ventricosus]